MITGFITTCPSCKKETRIPTLKIKDTSQLYDFPWWEKGNCQWCGVGIYIDIDIRVTKTELVEKEN